MSDYGDDEYDDILEDVLGDWLYVEEAYDEAVSSRLTCSVQTVSPTVFWHVS